MQTSEKPRMFTCLPRPRYVDDGWFDREMDEIIFRQWIYFGHESQIPEPGDMLVRDICDESIVAARDNSGAVQAFFNVCRHRGSRICDPGISRAKQFVCPYHRWSYGLDGRLLGAPSMREDDFDFTEYGLHRVHTEVWRGLIFVALGPEPPPRTVAEGLAGAAEEVDAYEPERLRVAHEHEYLIAANWKLVLENFLECYHCQGAHPELCRAADVPAMYDTLGDEEFMADEFWWSEFQHHEGFESFSISGAPASSKLLGKAIGGRNFALGLQPTLTSIGFYLDHAVMHEMLPVTTGQCRMTTQWLVRSDAVEGKDYDVEELTQIWHATNSQDVELCERNQLGVRSRSFVPGPNSPSREPAIRAALIEYHRLLGESDEVAALSN